MKLRTEDLTWREVGDELVVLKLSTSTYLALNTVARELWSQLEDGATAKELEEGLVARHEISTEQAAGDVGAFVANLRRLGLLAGDADAAAEPAS